MATTKEKTVKKVTLDNSYSAKQRTQRCEIRCSKNFDSIVNHIIDTRKTTYSKPSKADILHEAIKLLAEKEGVLIIGDSYYI